MGRKPYLHFEFWAIHEGLEDLRDALTDPALPRLGAGVKHNADICNDLSDALEGV